MTDESTAQPGTQRDTAFVENDGAPGLRGQKWWWRLAHLGVFGLVAEVAFVHLGAADGAPDEDIYRTCGEAYVHGSFTCNLEHPLLAKEILGIGSTIFGESIAAARATTALVAIATAYFCYLFCKEAAGRVAGLVAAALWGLLPQAGIENHVTLEAVRVDRFALLDPFVAAFVALALVAGGRLARRGGIGPALWLGVAVAGAACSKAPGVLIAPVACFVPLAYRRSRSKPIGHLALGVVGGAIGLTVASYAPLGPLGALRAIRYMFDFQLNHGARGGIVAGQFFVHAPWWADLSFATSAVGVPAAVVLGALALVGVVRVPKAAGYAVAVALSIVVGVDFGLHLSAPWYFVDWEPGAIAAASFGLVALAQHRSVAAKFVAIATCCVLAVGMGRTVVAANTLRPGPYATAAAAMQCTRSCLVAYVGHIDVFSNYLPSWEYLSAVPPSTRDGRVVARVEEGGRTIFEHPDFVALDPAAFDLHGSWRPAIRYFTTHAAALGYRRVAVASRVEVYLLVSSHAIG